MATITSSQQFKITIRDEPHFYSIVRWLDLNVGHGIKYWTMEGKVLRKLKDGKTATPIIHIINPSVETDISTFLNLL